MFLQTTPRLIAADIGNSRIKLGRFHSTAGVVGALPQPSEFCDIAVTDRTGEFDVSRLAEWCTRERSNSGDEKSLKSEAIWLIASVHRGAAERLEEELQRLAADEGANWRIVRLSFRDVPIPICVESPERVGIDRLLAALAANRLRRPERGVIVVDLGTATTVDLVNGRGEYCGGAIMPGISMSARALAEQTDALPHVSYDALSREPASVGKSTIAAIESGLHWGTVGAIRELVRQHSAGEALPPDVVITGGAAARFASHLTGDENFSSCQFKESAQLLHVETLVLSGIALAHEAASKT